MSPPAFADLAAWESFLSRPGDEVRAARYDLSVAKTLLPAVNPTFFRPAVTVAGTNGKGSVCWWLAKAFEEAGLRVGLYTSPHLLDLSERIRLNGRPVSPELALAEANRIHALVGTLSPPLPRPPTFFEWMTALAAGCFAVLQPDVHVLEVGMGGRLDAVNAAEPSLTVITGVDFDHCRFLGDDLASIAREKMGILRPDVPVVLGPDDAWTQGLEAELGSRARRVIRAGAVYQELFRQEEGAPAAAGRGTLPVLGLRGEFQERNAATVVAACRTLAAMGWPVTEAHAFRALRDGAWPGRLERLSRSPEVWADGAHNPQAVAAVAAHLAAEPLRPVAVFGCMQDKDCRRMLETLLPGVHALVLTRAPSPRSAGLDDYREALTPSGWAVVACRPGEKADEAPGGLPKQAAFLESPTEALQEGLRLAQGERPVYVLGSLYLVAAVKRGFGEK